MQGCCVAIDFVARAKNELLSNIPKRIVQGDTHGEKARRDFIGKGCLGK